MQTCSHCGASLVAEDCPNYGNGPDHADVDGAPCCPDGCVGPCTFPGYAENH